MNTATDTLAEAPAAAAQEELITHEFNESGVAETPEVIHVPMPKGCKCELRLARHADGGWRIGYDLVAAEDGLSTLPHANDDAHPDRHAALGAALAQARNFYAASPKSKLHKKCAGMVTAYATKLQSLPANTAPEKKAKVAIPQPKTLEVRVERIEENPHNPRGPVSVDEVTELADTIRDVGLLQPIGVRVIVVDGGLPGIGGDNRLQLLWGHRRAAAFKRLKRETIPAQVYEEISDEQARLLLLIENGQQKPLNPIQEARGYAEMVRDFGLTQDEVATQVNKSRPVVANAVRLLDLPEGVQELIATRKLTTAQGMALLAYKNYPAVCLFIAEKAIQDELTAGALEETFVGEMLMADQGLIFKAPREYVAPAELTKTGVIQQGDYGQYFLDEQVFKQEMARLKEEKKAAKEEEKKQAAKKAERAAKGTSTAAKSKAVLTPKDGQPVGDLSGYLLDLVPEDKVAKGLDYGGRKCTLVLDRPLWNAIETARTAVLEADAQEKVKPLIAAGWKRAETLKKIDGRAAALLMFAPADEIKIGAFSGGLAKRLKLTLAKIEKKALVEDIHYAAGCKIVVNELVVCDPLQLAKLCIGLRCEILEQLTTRGRIEHSMHWLRLVSGMEAPRLLDETKAKDQEEILRRVAASIAPAGPKAAAADPGIAYKFRDELCTNPQVIKVDLPKGAYFEMKVAQAPSGKWICVSDRGLEPEIDGMGGLYVPCLVREAKHKTREEAIMAELVEGKKDFYARKVELGPKCGDIVVDFIFDLKALLATGGAEK
jgi:ParB/RepB/Spo0J family partition protein